MFSGHCSIFWAGCLGLLLVGMSCQATEGAALHYHVAGLPSGDSEWPSRCVVQEERVVQYVYPSGQVEDLTIASSPDLEVSIDSVSRLRAYEMQSPSRPDLVGFDVRVVPEAEVMEAARALREKCPAHKIVVLLRGRPVWLEPSWTSWGAEVPAGLFPSIEAARDALSIDTREIELVTFDAGAHPGDPEGD